MTQRYLAALGALTIGIAVVSGTSGLVAGQAQSARTPWGEPDLRGVWRNETNTPLERPASVAGKEFYTEEEAAALVKKRVEAEAPLLAAGVAEGPTARQPAGTYNRTWQDTGLPPKVYTRTSMIVGPEGKIPFTPEAAKREEETDAHYGQGPYNSWLDVDTGERCLTDGLPGSVWTGTAGGPTQILQSPGYVVIVSEQFGDRRIIPTDGRPHGKIRGWLGESRGRWEGNTLVVDTTNFLDLTKYWWVARWREPTETMHMIERFTRVDAETINYQLTMEDPAKFTKPWTAEVPLTNLHQPLFEYACHEGNYGIIHTLLGQRAKDANPELHKGTTTPKGSSVIPD
jgi:hypothetical protein